jgi:hypothetical protein
MNLIFSCVVYLPQIFQASKLLKSIVCFHSLLFLFCFNTPEVFASQNIVIYRNTINEPISRSTLNSSLDVNLLLMIALVTCIVSIIVLYRRSYENHLNSQISIQNLLQRVEELETMFIDSDG